MNFNQPDKNFQKVEKLSQSLTFEDIKDDYEQFQKLIRKHHPDGNFRIEQDVQPAMGWWIPGKAINCCARVYALLIL